MAKFVEGRCMALIATDVAARGIDVEGINCVIHYDPAENGKVYKHRSGRTARAGAQGTVISLVQNPQKKMCSNLQKEVGIFVKFKPPEFNDLPKYEVEYIPPPRQKSKPRKPKRDAKRARFQPETIAPIHAGVARQDVEHQNSIKEPCNKSSQYQRTTNDCRNPDQLNFPFRY